MNPSTTAPRWQEIELSFRAEHTPANPYVDQFMWAEFVAPDGRRLRRPGFWAGGEVWKIRFVSDIAEGRWSWRTHARSPDAGLAGRRGELRAAPGAAEGGRFERHGLLRMSPGGRSVVHADGTPFLLVADTAWALPWRATPAEARDYAEARAAQGFNATLLMSLMPDLLTQGPEDRLAPGGFGRAFDDLPEGALRRLRADYFDTLDEIVAALVAAGIAPVWSPLFHGYGWKGGGVIGTVVTPEDAARHAVYLLARYGARPALWLASADGDANDPSVAATGAAWEEWDAYRQPTGVHYNPMSPRNDRHQDAAWLDFQWCQTGHNAEHRPDRVAAMTGNRPVKAIANGEPTYENMGRLGRADGWWQGEEAWLNFISGGTMGVVYGAASLWNWVRKPGDYPYPWCVAPGVDWREALDFEGARHVGFLGKILHGLPVLDLEPRLDWCMASRLVGAPGLAIAYLENGGHFRAWGTALPRAWRAFDPRTGEQTGAGRLEEANPVIELPEGAPRVLVFVGE